MKEGEMTLSDFLTWVWLKGFPFSCSCLWSQQAKNYIQSRQEVCKKSSFYESIKKSSILFSLSGNSKKQNNRWRKSSICFKFNLSLSLPGGKCYIYMADVDQGVGSRCRSPWSSLLIKKQQRMLIFSFRETVILVSAMTCQTRTTGFQGLLID